MGVRISKRLRGKLYKPLERLDHGHHVLRVYCQDMVGRMYEKFSTYLRVEVCVNRMIRLMEALLHAGPQLNGWRCAGIHQAILTTFGLPASLLERIGIVIVCPTKDLKLP